MISVPYGTANGDGWVSIESLFLSKRKVFILGDITEESACEFVQKIMFLIEDNSQERIHIYINSPGGDVDGGLLIYDTLKGLVTDYSLYCLGMAASMAAIILAGGKKGYRFILPHSKVMIHEPHIGIGIGGNASSIQKTAEAIMETKKMSIELLTKDTGRSIKEIEKAISYDNYMDAKQALKFGICDKVIDTVV